MNFEVFKKHPYWTGGGLLAVFIVVFFVRKSGGGSTTNQTYSGYPSTNQYDAQIASVQAASSLQQAQQQAQLQVAQLQAGVQQQAITASQDVTNNQTSAQLEAMKAQYEGQIKLAETQAGVQTAQINAGVQEKQNILDYLLNQDNSQTQVSLAQIEASRQLYLQQMQDQYNLNQTSLTHVKDVGGSQNRTAIILNSTGNSSGASTAVMAQTLSSMSGDNLLTGIASASSKALAALLA